MVKFSFPKKLRLLTSIYFNYVFQKSHRASSPEITILGRFNNLGYSRLGLSISKKNIKRAHERNRIKRLVREYFRLHQYELSSMDFIVLIRKGVIYLNNKEIIKVLDKLWRQHYRLSLNS
ncbi:MAG: ribonuclease P protein component [Arsenophonus sp. ER-NS5-MAG3]